MAERVAFRVEGFDCAEEVAILRKEVGRLNGVEALDFDVLNARMTVSFDAEALSQQDIIDAVARGGMKALPWEERAEEDRGTFWQEHGRLVMTTLSGAFLLAGFLTHFITHGSLADAFIASEAGEPHEFPLVSVILYVAAALSGSWYVLPKALVAGRKLRPDMNLLMTIAVIGAMLIGEWFEAATVAFLFGLALLLEHWSVGRARRAIKALLDLSPPTARFRCPEHDHIEEKPVEEVPLGVTVIVRPGERIPLDGKVTKGASAVNQAPITGESIPVFKGPEDEVYAGTINGDGALELEVTKCANDTTLARIIHMVQEAQSRRAPAEQWVEKFARWYTPLMMALAVLIAVLPPLIMGGIWVEWLYRGLVVLVIACPCALVISTPVSIVSGLTAAARNGVLIKGGMYLEAAGRLRAIALDKTGTLTYGHPEVQQVVPFNGHTPRELLERAAALEAHSEHPLARAILKRAELEGIAPSAAENFQVVKGKGAQGRIGGRPFWIGSHRFMDEYGQPPEIHNKAEELEDAGHSVVAIGNAGHVCGLISVADSVRQGAPDTLKALRNLGIEKIVMLTGDNEGTARAVARATGVDEFRSELLPAEKVAAVGAIAAETRHVAMVGDGVNDAPALAAANVGVAMGAVGSDAAIETADIALMSDDLAKLPWLIRHSRRTLAIIKQNISFALGLKCLFIALTLFGVASLWMAIAADMGASLLVIFNGLRLLQVGGDEQ